MKSSFDPEIVAFVLAEIRRDPTLIERPHYRAVLRGGVFHGEHPDLRRRSLPVRFRAQTAVRDGVVSGVAAAFDVRYKIAPDRDEVIEPFAFTRSIEARPRVPVFREHEWSTPIATADLWQESRGLMFRTGEFFDSDVARAWHRVVVEGGLDGVSIGFVPRALRQEERGKLDVIEQAEVLEISLVLRGANPGARVEAA